MLENQAEDSEERLYLLGPFCKPRSLVTLSLQLGPEEGIEVMYIQWFLSPVLRGVLLTGL